MSEREIDAWGVCYGNRNGGLDEMDLISAHKTKEQALDEAINWSFNNEGDPNYFVMPLYRKDKGEQQ